MKRPAALLFLLVALFAAVPPTVAAHQPAPQEEFVPLDEVPPQEQIPAVGLVAAAYAFVWVVLLAYVWSVWRRLARVERDLADVERRLSRPRNV